MTILVIGTGAIGQRHAGNLEALGEEVTRYSWREGGLSGLKDVIKTANPEAAIICTATDLRLDVLQVTSAADLPVYLEKPVAFRSDDLKAIEDTLGPLADRSFAGFMMRYHPAVQYLAAQDLSHIFRFDLEIGHDVHQWRQDWAFADSYAARPEGGGVLLDLCHELDMAATILPDLQLQSVTSLDHAQHAKLDFATTLTLMSDQAAGTVSMDYLAPASKRSTRLRGRDLCFDFDFAKNTYSASDARGDRDIPGLTIDRQEMFKAAMADFLSLVRTGQTDNPIAPIFSHCHSVNQLICSAWESRQFIGSLEERS